MTSSELSVFLYYRSPRIQRQVALATEPHLHSVSHRRATGDPPTIETLEFVSRDELTKRLNLFIGMGEDTLVCYAVLRGPFLMTRMSLPPGSAPGPHFSTTVLEIYDAATGRLLIWGGGPPRPRPGQ